MKPVPLPHQSHQRGLQAGRITVVTVVATCNDIMIQTVLPESLSNDLILAKKCAHINVIPAAPDSGGVEGGERVSEGGGEPEKGTTNP